jgi:hypothetical protein
MGDVLHNLRKVFKTCADCKGRKTHDKSLSLVLFVLVRIKNITWINESRWEKGFFGGEVKKEYRLTCPECRGCKFSWVIAHELRNSQIEKSNL